MFSATVMRSNRPRVLRSSVTMAIPALIASSGWVNRTGRPSSRIVPAGRAGPAPKMASSSSVRPAPSSPATPRTSPARTENVMFAQAGPAAAARAGQRQALDLEHRLLGDRVRHVVQRGDLAAHHPADDLVGRGLPSRGAGDELAVAEHGHPVGQGEDLVHLVADVEDRRPGFAQVGDDAEEPRDLGVRQRRRGLVHDHDRGVEGQRLGDLDHLLIADPQVADLGPRCDRGAQAVEQPPRLGLHRAVVQPAEPAAPGLLTAQEDVVGDRELGNEVQLLVDDPDPGVLGLAEAPRTGPAGRSSGSRPRIR